MNEKRKHTLYIIGNGFDLYHGIPSSFGEFRNYVKKQNSDIFEYVEKHLSAGENWSDLEEAFGFVDPHDLMDEGAEYLESYGSDDWSDSNHHIVEEIVSDITSGLSNQLLNLFEEWLMTLGTPALETKRDRPRFTATTSAFLAFLDSLFFLAPLRSVRQIFLILEHSSN